MTRDEKRLAICAFCTENTRQIVQRKFGPNIGKTKNVRSRNQKPVLNFTFFLKIL
jgi:hypothetical protein